MMKTLRILFTASILAIGIGGGFAPWIYREPAALQLTAPGLAEYVKFLAEVRLGQLPVQRLHFLLPLAAAALSLPLAAANRRLALHWSLNWLFRFSALPMALALLSPVWAPGVLLSAEFRLQTMAAAAVVGLAIAAPLLKWLPLRWLAGGIALASLVAVALALRQFYLANQAIAATYAGPIRLGWGGWLTLGGAIGAVISAGWLWRLKY